VLKTYSSKDLQFNRHDIDERFYLGAWVIHVQMRFLVSHFESAVRTHRFDVNTLL